MIKGLERWRQSTIWYLEGSPYELHSEGWSGLWFVVHKDRPRTKLAGPFELRVARASVERREVERQKRLKKKRLMVWTGPVNMKPKPKKRPKKAR